jgi:glucose/arabinose dehydrogenase
MHRDKEHDMASRLRSLFALSASLAFLCLLVTSSATRAHPPHAPFLNPFGKDTKFAPITRFGPKVSVELVADGMTAPLKGVAAPGLSRWLFVVDQPGIVWAVDLSNPNTETNKTMFLDVRSLIVTLGVCGPSTFDERGLLGIAFHPQFQKNGLFYTYTSERRDTGAATIPTPGTTVANADHHNVVSEWQANDPDHPQAGAKMVRRELMRVNWPQFNHDGGDLAFGPDGKLYISTGDGGGADDADGQPFVTAPPHHPVCGEAPIFGHQVNGNGQKLNTPLGKILRIDVNPPFTPGKQYRVPRDNPFVDQAGVVPEIWAYGFRNPYRFSFDRKTGDLYVGDVGQNDIEEVDIVTGGGNFGWNCKEGTAFFYINGSVPDDGFADESPNFRHPDTGAPIVRGDCTSGRRPLIDPIAQHDTHREGHSVVAGFVYHGHEVQALRGQYVFADFSLLFKFPFGPHDYGRLFIMNAHGSSHGLRRISELMVVPGGAISLAVLGMGQDANGEIYVSGNISGLPFPDAGPDETLNTPDDIFRGRIVRIITAEDARGGHGGHND